MGRFLKTSLGFLAGLACVLLATDRFTGWRVARNHGKGSFAPEVYASIASARRASTDVRAIYLGDSVARELFPPGAPQSPDERFLACNQAISMAGQYYLMADALDHCPGARDVYLLYYPGSFGNNLGPPLTGDYFCGWFHRPSQIREAFGETRDARIVASQVGRLLLPHVLEENAVNRPMVYPAGPSGGAAPAPATNAASALGPEPMLALINRWTGGGNRPAFMPPEFDAQGRQLVTLSPVSRDFLAKMRALCGSRGVGFHVLPSPCSDADPYVDNERIYDGPILYEPASEFVDGVHLRHPFVNAARQRMIATYHLPIR